MAELFAADDPELLAYQRTQAPAALAMRERPPIDIGMESLSHRPSEGAAGVLPPGPAPAPSAMTSDLPRVPVATAAEPAAAPTPIAPPPGMPAPPVIGPTVHKTSTWQNSETYDKPTAATAGIVKKLGDAGADAVTAAGEAKDAKVRAALDESFGARKDAAEVEEARIAAEAKQAAARKAYEDSSAFLAQERDRVTKENTTSYWADKGTASHVLSALAVGLGEVGAKLTGGTNAAMHILDSAMARDAQFKERRLQAEMSKLGIKGAEAQERFGYAQTEIKNQQAGMWQRLEMERRTRLAKAGITGAEADGDAIVAETKRRAATDAMAVDQSMKHHVSKVSGGSKSTSNEEEQKAAIAAAGLGAGAGRAAGKQMEYAQMAANGKEDLAIIDKGPRLTQADWRKVQDNITALKAAEHSSQTTGGSIMTRAGRALGMVPRDAYDGLPPEKRKVAQAYDLLSTKAAAVVEPSSAEGAQERVKGRFFPTGADDPATTRQRLEMMRTQIAVAEANSGAIGQRGIQAAQRAGAAAAEAPPAPPAASLPALSMQDMQTLRDEVRAGGPHAAAAARTLAAYANRGR